MRNLQRIGQEVIALCSRGEKEALQAVENHLEKGDVIEYLIHKYHLDIKVEAIKELDKKLNTYADYVIGNEDRKYGIISEDQGLLLILSLLFEIL